MPPQLSTHCIVDHDTTHRHTKVKAWLAARPRWQRHFIPNYGVWLNQVERFLSLTKAIRQDSFTSVKQLVQRIDHFVAVYNPNCQRSRWPTTLTRYSKSCVNVTHVSAGRDTSSLAHWQLTVTSESLLLAVTPVGLVTWQVPTRGCCATTTL